LSAKRARAPKRVALDIVVSDVVEAHAALRAARTDLERVAEIHVERGPARFAVLLAGDRCFMMFLRFVGDAGFSSRNPAAKGRKVVTFTMANGQADDYPLASTYPVDDGFRALSTFIDTGRVPDDLGWRNDARDGQSSPNASVPASVDPTLEAAVDALRTLGWNVVLLEKPQPLLTREQSARYPTFPQAVRDRLGRLATCRSADETAWIYSAADYARDEPGTMRWNECEHISLDASDEDEAAIVRSFWDVHVPFAMASHSDYDYLALCLEPGPTFGAVVHGLAPLFEETTVVAPSFDAFLILLVQQVRERDERGSLWPFLLTT
jgi:hypothetical protein